MSNNFGTKAPNIVKEAYHIDRKAGTAFGPMRFQRKWKTYV